MNENPVLQRVAEHPRLFVVPEFLSADACAVLATIACDDAALARNGVTLQRDVTGTSGELPVTLHPELQALAERIEATLGLTNHVGGTLRLRRYGLGQGHPPHVDTYTIAGHELIATAIVCLRAPEAGGETVFPDTPEGPLQLSHAVGQLVAWHDVRGDGEADAHSLHLATPVLAGEKLILSAFIYGDPTAVLNAPSGHRATAELRATLRQLQPECRVGALRGFGRALAVVDDGVPQIGRAHV